MYPLAVGFILMFFWYGLGFYFFISGVPEKWYPKNYIVVHFFSSHTLWHICVLNAVYVWFHFLYKYREVTHQIGLIYYTIISMKLLFIRMCIAFVMVVGQLDCYCFADIKFNKILFTDIRLHNNNLRIHI